MNQLMGTIILPCSPIHTPTPNLTGVIQSRAYTEPSLPNVITPGYIEELDDEGRLVDSEYLHYEVTDEECDSMGEMCDPYEGL